MMPGAERHWAAPAGKMVLFGRTQGGREAMTS